jgi:Flp pilus assembly protein TadB
MKPIILLLLLPVLTGLLLLLVARNERRHQFLKQRLTTLTADNDSEPAPLSLARQVKNTSLAVFQIPRKLGAMLNSAFEAAGNRIGVLHLLLAALVSAFIVVVFANNLLSVNPSFLTPLGLIAGSAGAFLLLRMAQARYRRRFLDVFPDALDLVGRGVKAGLPVNEALAAAASEIADPVGSELRRALDQVKIGVHMNDALNQVADRIRVGDFRFVVVALALQAKTGGSLAETLGNLSGVVRARKALRLKARGLSAEARTSIGVLSVLPLFVTGLMYFVNHDLISILFTDPRGRFMFGVALLTIVAGVAVSTILVKRAVR